MAQRGGVGAVEDAGDDDGVVGGVVVAEHAARGVGGPGEDGASHEAVEEAQVEGFEDFFEVVDVAEGGGDALAPAGLADVFGAAGNGFRGDVAAVAVGMGGGDGLAVKLGQGGCARWRGWTGSGAASRRSERRTCRWPSRRRMVVLSEVKRRKRTSKGGWGARGRRSRYSSSKMAVRVVDAACTAGLRLTCGGAGGCGTHVSESRDGAPGFVALLRLGGFVGLVGWVGEEVGLLVFEELAGGFADVDDAFEGPACGRGCRLRCRAGT